MACVLTARAATDVFFSNQGSQGILGKPSKQQLENTFGTTNEMEIIGQILAKGTPEQIAEVAESHTGAFLAEVLGQERDSRKAG